MNKELIQEVKKKKEFSLLPDSIIERALNLSKDNVKDTRAFLRKYFGVFLTNKVMKGRDEEVLSSHISSKFRDYGVFYKEIFTGKKVSSIIDLGCGVNGFSYPLLVEVLGEVNYLGVEASGQVVENTNSFLEEEKFNSARVEHLDLFDLSKITNLIKTQESPRAILILQTLDALEGLERNYSKTLLLGLSEVMNKQDFFVISMPLKSISGKKKFEARRTWISNFLEENFLVEKDTEIGNERVFIVRKK